jgi:ribosomal protein S19
MAAMFVNVEIIPEMIGHALGEFARQEIQLHTQDRA